MYNANICFKVNSKLNKSAS